jgi:dTDP-4-dehydrorhamnose reductase/SAM-dependent methyltransferase
MKIVLFGATGMLGRYVLEVLKDKYDTTCILRDDYDIETDTWLKLEDILTNNLQKNDVIINCAGIIPQKYKKDNYRTYIRVNTLFPHKLDEITKKICCRFIHITTDCVFDGVNGNYSINDVHTSTDIYGTSKSLGEPEDATIIRTSIIGEELFGKKSLIEWVKSNKNGNIKGYTNHFWNGVTCLELAKCIKNVLDNNTFWNGIKHICSPNIVTKYELCCYINEIYDLNIEITPIETECKNLCLVSDNLFNVDAIYNQLIEQKEFNINYGYYENLNSCRFCNADNLCEIMKFDDYPLSGGFLKNKKNIIYEKIFPLTFLFCENCKTGLIKEIVKEDYLFTNINESSYFYYSSTISSLVTHFKNLYEKIIVEYPNKKKILEIGCNDGVFINNFVDKGYNIIGIDPSETIHKIDSSDIVKYNTFFNDDSTLDILTKYGKQDIIVSCNCLAHINDMFNIYSNIKKILNHDGVLIIEVHYLKNIIDNFNFDFIYHEHMSYYSINTVIQICKCNDLFLENIEFINTHGGSIRAIISHKKNEQNGHFNIELEKYLNKEKEYKLNINNLFEKLDLWKTNILLKIDNIKKDNLLVGYGASGRTNMIINYLSTKFDVIVDDSIHKIGSFIPFYHTKIESSDSIYSNSKIKVILILAWPYTESILKKHIKFIKNGGVFIKILPNIEVIDFSNFENYLAQH